MTKGENDCVLSTTLVAIGSLTGGSQLRHDSAIGVSFCFWRNQVGGGEKAEWDHQQEKVNFEKKNGRESEESFKEEVGEEQMNIQQETKNGRDFIKGKHDERGKKISKSLVHGRVELRGTWPDWGTEKNGERQENLLHGRHLDSHGRKKKGLVLRLKGRGGEKQGTAVV